MTSIKSPAPCTRRNSRRLQVRGVMALAATLAIAPTSVLAEAQVQGSPEAMRIETQNSSIEEVLAALGNAFDVRYRSSANLAKQLSGTYEGSLQRVVARVLEGYDFVLRNNKGKIEITVLGTRNAAPAAVASTTSTPAKAAPNSTTGPAAPAAAPSKASERPAPVTPPAVPPSGGLKVAEGPMPASSSPESTKVAGLNLAAAMPAGLTPTPAAAEGGPIIPTPTPSSGSAPIPEPVAGGAAVPMPIPGSGSAPFPEPVTGGADLPPPGMSSGSTPIPAPAPSLTPAVATVPTPVDSSPPVSR
jgi:hypothetical protein